MMNEAKKKKFDILLVRKLDRLSRSMKDLINTLDELGNRNAKCLVDYYTVNIL